MFLFKKIVGPLLLRVSVGLEVMLLGLFFLWFTRKEKAGKGVLDTGYWLLDAGYGARNKEHGARSKE